MSLYDVILKELGLNEGDEFKTISYAGIIHKFEEGRLMYLSSFNTWEPSFLHVNELLRGITITKRAPWVPKVGESYYIPIPYTRDLFAFTRFTNDEIDKIRVERGIVFRNSTEAIACAKKMLDAIKGD